MHDKNNSNPIYLYVISFMGFIACGIALAYYYLEIFVNKEFLKDQVQTQMSWAWFGDFLGGTLGPFLAFLGLIALLLSIHYQRIELEKSTKQLEESAIALKNQNDLIKKQNIEATFFQLLKLYNEIVQGLQIIAEGVNSNRKPIEIIKINRECITYSFGLVRYQLQEKGYENETNDQKRLELIEEAYEIVFAKYSNAIGHYFRNIYLIFKFIDDSDMEFKDKENYANILRSQFSRDELNLLLYNSLSKYGKETILPLVKRYDLLKYLEKDNAGVLSKHDDKLLIDAALLTVNQ